jgi:hypothetical protein
MKNFLRGRHVSVFKFSETNFNGGKTRGKETTWKTQVKDGRIILRRIFRKWGVGHELDRSGLGQGQVAGSCNAVMNLQSP